MSHIDIPTAYTVLPSACYQLGMRAAVHIDDRRIFLRLIQTDRFYQTEIQIGDTICRLDFSGNDFRHRITFVRILRRQQRP